ncbi:MAG: sulfatase [Acidobacteriota bacterium]
MKSTVARLLVSLLLSTLAACRPPSPQQDTALVDRFVVSSSAGSSARQVRQGEQTIEIRDTDGPRHLAVGHSHRLAVTTWEGVARDAEVTIGADAVLALTITGLLPATEIDSAPRRATARVRLVDSEGRVVVDREAEVDETWRRHRMALPPIEGGRLQIESVGAAPVAWAEIHLLGDPVAPSISAEKSSTETPPNLILVVIDTLRADHLSLYGYEYATSPRLDALADSAHVFDRSYSASTWTLPSTGSLLTGLLPAQHGLRSLHDALPEEVVTVTERLRSQGYRTAAITDGGFLDPRWGFRQGFERYDVTEGRAWQPKDVAAITTAAREWIEDNAYEPFFLLVHTYETHHPYLNPEGHAAPFFDGDAPAQSGVVGDDVILKTYTREPMTPPSPLVTENLGLYVGEIRRADQYVGELLDLVLDSPAGDRTAILITSDHGEEFLEHGNVEHGLGKVFDANVRVPMILKLPGQQVGSRQATPVSGIDVAPTLLDLAGIESPEGQQGDSLRAWVDGAADPGRRVLVEGINSFPNLNENRYRVDDGDITLIHDLVRGRSIWFDRSTDPAMDEPRLDLADPRVAAAVDRLQAVLAWTSRGKMAVRLAAGPHRITAAAGSRVVPIGAWVGLDWRPVAATVDGAAVDLDPTRASYMVFDLGEVGGAWDIALFDVDGTSTRHTVTTRGGDGSPLVWRSADRQIPPFDVVFPTFAFFDPDAAEMTPEATQELKALGYLGD